LREAAEVRRIAAPPAALARGESSPASEACDFRATERHCLHYPLSAFYSQVAVSGAHLVVKAQFVLYRP
jgi:hypothetical protein